MAMLHYQSLEALLAVVDAKSFHGAARLLHLTQSAVSQRIATLEEQIGERVLLRVTPPRLTERGVALVAHARRVSALERELGILPSPGVSAPTVIRLGVNADSLATWFLEALSRAKLGEGLLLQLVVDNEDHTFQRMKAGEVLACVSSAKRSLPGCESLYLGDLPYLCCASRRFAKKHFVGGITATNAVEAPAVLFDEKDRMHHRFLAKHLGVRSTRFPHHLVPTSQGFCEFIVRGFAFGVVPEPQIRQALRTGRVVDLKVGCRIEVPLYWHSPRTLSKRESALRTELVSLSRALLRGASAH